MALSRIVAIGNGSATQFAIPFALGFIKRSDVTCQVGAEQDGSGNPIYRPMTWISDELVDIAGTGPVPGVGVRVTFTRTVDRDELIVDYEDGDIINEENMNTAQKQALMLVHEVLDGRFEQFQANFDLGGFQIKNLGEPTVGTDAATKNYADSRIADGASNAAAAAASAAAAAASAAAASGFATTAGTAAQNSINAATASAEARNTSVAAANATAGSVTAAATSATSAAASASEALGYRNTANSAATTATTKAGEASGSATAAATSATNAANSATASDTARGQAVTAKDQAVAVTSAFVSAYGNQVVTWTATAGQSTFLGATANPPITVDLPAKNYVNLNLNGRPLLKSEFSILGKDVILNFVDAEAGEVLELSAGTIMPVPAPAPGSVTNAMLSGEALDNSKLASMPAATIKGRVGGSNGNPQDLTPEQAREAIGINLGYPLLHVAHETANNVDGGDLVGGYSTRPLNTVLTNEITGASLANNIVTLPVGTYWVEGEVFVYMANRYGVYFQSTPSQDIGVNGLTIYARASTEAGGVTSLRGRLVIPTVPRNFTLMQFAEIGKTILGLGIANNGLRNRFADIRIYKLK